MERRATKTKTTTTKRTHEFQRDGKQVASKQTKICSAPFIMKEIKKK